MAIVVEMGHYAPGRPVVWTDVTDRLGDRAKISYAYESTAFAYGVAKVSSGDIEFDDREELISQLLAEPPTRLRVLAGGREVFLGHVTQKTTRADERKKQVRLQCVGMESLIYDMPLSLYADELRRVKIYDIDPSLQDSRGGFLSRVYAAIQTLYPEVEFLYDQLRPPDWPNPARSFDPVVIEDYDLDSATLCEDTASIGDALNKLLAFENAILSWDYELSAIVIRGRGIYLRGQESLYRLTDVLDVTESSDGAEKIINRIVRSNAGDTPDEVLEDAHSIRAWGRRELRLDGSFCYIGANLPGHAVYEPTDLFPKHILAALNRPYRSVEVLTRAEVPGLDPRLFSLGKCLELSPAMEPETPSRPSWFSDNPVTPQDVKGSFFGRNSPVDGRELLWRQRGDVAYGAAAGQDVLMLTAAADRFPLFSSAAAETTVFVSLVSRDAAGQVKVNFRDAVSGGALADLAADSAPATGVAYVLGLRLRDAEVWGPLRKVAGTTGIYRADFSAAPAPFARFEAAARAQADPAHICLVDARVPGAVAEQEGRYARLFARTDRGDRLPFVWQEGSPGG